jgi:dipeptidase E
LHRLHGLGWREFDIVELNGLPRQMVLDRLRHADVICVEGGSHYHLARNITGNGLADRFLKVLEDRVYVGVSAGSMIFSRNLDERSADIMGDAARTCTSSERRRWSRRAAARCRPGPPGRRAAGARGRR